MRQTASISKAHHYFKVHDFYEQFFESVIKPFTRQHLCKRVKKPGVRGARPQWEITHVFARGNAARTEYRFPSELLKDFIEFAVYKGYSQSRFLIDDVPVIEPKRVSFELNPAFSNPFPKQWEWINYMLDDGYIKINNDNTGGGKAQPLSAKLKVPGGWKQMGDIKKGDLVIARDGTPTQVTGVFPQGVTDVWRVHFADGRHTDVNPEHLWRILDSDNQTHRTLDTRAVSKLLEASPSRVYVPLCEAEDGPAKPFKIHPYLMGVLLGDGGFTHGNVTVNKPYQQMFDRISELLPANLTCKWRDSVTFAIVFKDGYRPGEEQWHVRTGLRECGLMGLKSHEKFVPEEYLEGSRQQRLELLQGLLDTDGTVTKSKSVSFSSSSLQLAEAVQYLVRSLGGIARLTSRIPHYTHLGERKAGRTTYKVSIRYPRPEELFTLAHKQERAKATQYSGTLKLRMVRIEELAPEPTQCISVAHEEHLYVTDDFIVTHNTFMSIYSMVQLGMRTVATMQPRYIHNFVKELYNVVKFGPGDVLIWEQDLSILKKVMDEGVYDPKVVIIPMSRIEVYLRHEKEGREQPTLDEVYESIRPGLRIIDEGHESIHQIFLSLCYGNLHKTFVLSATLRADDPFNNKAYSWLYPFRYRLKEAEPEHYIDIVFYMYRMNLRKFRIKTEQYGGYNDKTFEESILKSEVVLKFYFELIDKAFQEYYLGRRREGTKCFMFFSRVNMCYAMQKLFKDRYPHLDIETFTGDDTKKKELKDKYLKHEIIITTPNSCGTGKDAPGMITVLCPHTVSSTQANKQIIGRLRDTAKLFNGELPPIFVAFGCFDISKQCDYLDKRAEAFAPKKKTLTRVNSECALD